MRSCPARHNAGQASSKALVETIALKETDELLPRHRAVRLSPYAPASREGGGEQVSLLRFPYPYRAMVAVCSDLDSTPDWQTYWLIVKFLNTTASTSMGHGVGLEVGNSIYFDMPPNECAYWNTDDAGRDMFRTLMRSGHIDCLHSYGGLATTRDHARRALDELARHGCRLSIWVDHGRSPTNFGPDIMHGHGDETGHAAYHADLTVDHGIRYVCRGRATSVIGQDAPPRIGGIFTARHPLRSCKTAAKELVKRALAHGGSAKYAMHAGNRALRLASLRDGRRVWEFLRSNPHWGGISCCDTASGLGEVVTDEMLDLLVARQGVCILYTHLGKVNDAQQPFPAATRQALQRLASYHRDGKVLVTTTHRLLRYLALRESMRYQAEHVGDSVVITIESMAEPIEGTRSPRLEEVQGITFEVPRKLPVKLRLGGLGEVPFRLTQAGDSVFVTIPWKFLVFPAR